MKQSSHSIIHLLLTLGISLTEFSGKNVLIYILLFFWWHLPQHTKCPRTSEGFGAWTKPAAGGNSSRASEQVRLMWPNWRSVYRCWPSGETPPPLVYLSTNSWCLPEAVATACLLGKHIVVVFLFWKGNNWSSDVLSAKGRKIPPWWEWGSDGKSPRAHSVYVYVMFDVRNSAAAVNDPHGVESFRAPHLKFSWTRRFEKGDKNFCWVSVDDDVIIWAAVLVGWQVGWLVGL